MKPITPHTELDDIKYKVDTSPLKSGGANFKTNVLKQVSPYKFVYKPSIGAAIFSFIFLAIGLGVLFFGIMPVFKTNTVNTNSIDWFFILFGLFFSCIGGFLFYTFYKPKVFDKQKGLYYSTYTFKHFQSHRKQNYVPFKSIVALQIIGEYVNSDKGSYKSFELNLVLDDASRKNVIDHGNLKSIITDAEVLSAFLNIPIWHAKSVND